MDIFKQLMTLPIGTYIIGPMAATYRIFDLADAAGITISTIFAGDDLAYYYRL